MNNYEGLTCPVCHAKLFEDDDIVVCPDCGAPHHRDCYISLGKCAFSEDHGTPRQWKMPVENENLENDPPYGGAGKTCRKCGKVSPPDVSFCPYCGEPFLKNGEKSEDPAPPPFLFGRPFPGGGMQSLHPFFDPMGGVNPEETIDGVPVRDVAAFVAVNTPRYIPVFKSLDKPAKKYSHWNWAAFLLPECWLFYRKCYKIGFFAAFIALISNIFATPFLLAYTDLLSRLPLNEDSQQQSTLFVLDNLSKIPSSTLWFAVVGLLIALGVRIVFGLLGDRFYKTHVITRVKAIQSETDGDEKKTKSEMTRQGSVNLMLGLAAYMTVNLVSTLLQTFLM